MTKAGKTALAVGIVVLIVVAARAALPGLVESYANDRLAELDDYTGSVDDVDLNLWRGAYVVHGVRIVKRDTQFDEPFFAVERIDLSLQWPALLEAALVGEAALHRPVLNLIQAESDEESQLGGEEDWAQRFDALTPFRLNELEATDGVVRFRAPGIEAEHAMTLQQARLVLLNLTNLEDSSEPAFADLELSGRVMGRAPLLLAGQIAPNESTPTFDFDLSLESAEIAEINPWLREFLNVDAETGTFFLYAEIAAADGGFEGYLRPILENPNVLDLDDENKGPLQTAWEGLVQIATELLENPDENQVATQIPFSGEIEDPEAGLIPAIVNLLRNAFVAAFSRSLEGTVSLAGASGESEGDSDDGSDDGSDNGSEAGSADDADTQ